MWTEEAIGISSRSRALGLFTWGTCNVSELEAVFPCSKTLAGSVPTSVGVAGYGQLYGLGVHQQAGGTRSQPLAWLTMDLLEWCHAQGFYLFARHFSGLWFGQADGFSLKGQIQPTQWSLSPLAIRLLSCL